MHIDWITVVAQAINFLILVYLLRRFLYQPVMRAMQQREQAIARQLQDAQQREQAAADAAATLREQTEAFSRDRDRRLSEVDQEAEVRRQTLLEEVRREVEARRAQWDEELERERKDHLHQFRPKAAAALTRAARKLLTDMADADLEQQLIRTFVRRIETLDHAELATLRKSARKAGRLRVSTSFETDEDTRNRIRRALQHHLLDDRKTETDIDFQRSPQLACGIEVDTDGRKIGWTVDNYLQALEAELGAATAQPEGNRNA